MRLIFDANLSPKLVSRLNGLFPDSLHVQEIGLTSSDNQIWQFALEQGPAFVTKHDDF